MRRLDLGTADTGDSGAKEIESRGILTRNSRGFCAWRLRHHLRISSVLRLLSPSRVGSVDWSTGNEPVHHAEVNPCEIFADDSQRTIALPKIR